MVNSKEQPPSSASSQLPVPAKTAAAPLPPISLRQYLALATALWGTFEANLGSQLAGAGLTDIQGGLGVSADEASWIGTVYPMAQVVAVPLAAILAQAFGIRNFLRLITGLFLFSCLLSGLSHTLEAEVVLRVLQGLAGGSFGVTAFSLTLRMFAGRNLAAGIAMLALATTLPNALGILGAGQFVELWGWKSLYLVEAVFSLITLVGVHLFLDIQSFQFKAFENLDWGGFFLLAPGAALIIMGLSQGDRRFWTEAPWIGYAFVIGTVLILVFIYMELNRENPLINPRLALYRSFGTGCLLNMLFRVALLDVAIIMPRFLTSLQNYRNLEISNVLWLPAAAQTLMYAAMPWFYRTVKAHYLIMAGLICLGVGALCDFDNTSISDADQFLFSQFLIGLAPPLFLVPVLCLGTRDVKPQDGRSAGVFWNYSIIFGTVGSAALASYVTRMREYYHSNRLNDFVSNSWAPTAARIDGASAALGSRITDDGGANVAAVASVAQESSRQALLLALDDMFLIIGVVALLSAVLIFRIPPQQKEKVSS